MSTNLTLIANHSLDFIQSEPQVQSVIELLDSITLDCDFIYSFQKNWFENNKDVNISKVKSIKWQVVPYTIERNEIGVFFKGDCALRIAICRNTFSISNPYRFNILERLNSQDIIESFDKWRRTWQSLTRHLGGDQILYLNENDDKIIEAHWNNEPINEIVLKCRQNSHKVTSDFNQVRNHHVASLRFLDML